MAKQSLPVIEVFSTFTDPSKPFHDQVKGDHFWIQMPFDGSSLDYHNINESIFSERAYQQYDPPTFATMSSRYTSNAMVCTGNTCAVFGESGQWGHFRLGYSSTTEFWLEPDNVNTTEKQMIFSVFSYNYERIPPSSYNRGYNHFYLFLQNGKLIFEFGWTKLQDTVKIIVDVSNKTAPFHVSISGSQIGQKAATSVEDTANTRVFIDGQFVQPEIVNSNNTTIDIMSPCLTFIGAPPIFKTPYEGEVTGYKGKIAQLVFSDDYVLREGNFTPRTSAHTSTSKSSALPSGLDDRANICLNLASITDRELINNKKMLFTMPNVYSTNSRFDGYSCEVNSQSGIVLLSDSINLNKQKSNGQNTVFSSFTIEFCAKYNSNLDPDLANTSSTQPISMIYGGYDNRGRWTTYNLSLLEWTVHPANATNSTYGTMYIMDSEGKRENSGRTSFFHVAITWDGLFIRTFVNGQLLSSYQDGGNDGSGTFSESHISTENEYNRIVLGGQYDKGNYYALSHIIVVDGACAYTKSFTITYPPRLVAYRHNNKTNYMVLRNNYSEQWYAKVDMYRTAYQWKAIIKGQPYIADLVPVITDQAQVETHGDIALRIKGQKCVFQNSTTPIVFFDPCHNQWVRTNTMEDYLFLKNIEGAGYYDYCYILDYNGNHNQKICEQDIGIYCYNPNLLNLNGSWTIEIGCYFFDDAHMNGERIFELYGALMLDTQQLVLYNASGGVQASFDIEEGQIQSGQWHVFNLIKNGTRMSLYLDKVIMTFSDTVIGEGNTIFSSGATNIDFSRRLASGSTNYLFKRNDYFRIGGGNYEMGVDMCRISNVARTASLSHTTYRHSSVTTNVTAQLLFNKFGGFAGDGKWNLPTCIES